MVKDFLARLATAQPIETPAHLPSIVSEGVPGLKKFDPNSVGYIQRPGLFGRAAAFMHNAKQADENGLTLSDKLAHLGSAMSDDRDDFAYSQQLMQRQRAASAKERLAEAQEEALMAQGRRVGLTDRELFLARLNPESLAGLMKEQDSPYTLGQGDLRAGPDGLIGYNPKTGVDGGFAYSVGADGDVRWGSQRPVSHGERIDQFKAETGRLLGAERLDQNGERIEIARTNANRPRGVFGGAAGRGSASRPPPPPGFVPVRP